MGANLRSLWHWTAAGLTAVFWLSLLSALALVLEPRRYLKLIQRAFFAILRAAGMRLRVVGLEHVPLGGAILMGNHVNFFEPFMLAAVVPTHTVGVEKASNFKLPLYGWLARRWGNVPIVRENLEEAKRALAIARERLESGVSIAILPEGTRSKTGEMGPFKKGPFHLALEAQAPIVPFAFVDNDRFYSGGSWRLTPGPVAVVFGPPIPTAGLTKADLQPLSDRVKGAIQNLLDENRAGA